LAAAIAATTTGCASLAESEASDTSGVGTGSAIGAETGVKATVNDQVEAVEVEAKTKLKAAEDKVEAEAKEAVEHVKLR
jgi:serine acetyltransferase